MKSVQQSKWRKAVYPISIGAGWGLNTGAKGIGEGYEYVTLGFDLVALALIVFGVVGIVRSRRRPLEQKAESGKGSQEKSFKVESPLLP